MEEKFISMLVDVWGKINPILAFLLGLIALYYFPEKQWIGLSLLAVFLAKIFIFMYKKYRDSEILGSKLRSLNKDEKQLLSDCLKGNSQTCNVYFSDYSGKGSIGNKGEKGSTLDYQKIKVTCVGLDEKKIISLKLPSSSIVYTISDDAWNKIKQLKKKDPNFLI